MDKESLDTVEAVKAELRRLNSVSNLHTKWIEEWRQKYQQLENLYAERGQHLKDAQNRGFDLIDEMVAIKADLRAARVVGAMRADQVTTLDHDKMQLEKDIEDLELLQRSLLYRIQGLEEMLSLLEERHPRAVKLMRQNKPFIVIKTDEPYASFVMQLVKFNALKDGSWTPECERWAKEQFGPDWALAPSSYNIPGKADEC